MIFNTEILRIHPANITKNGNRSLCTRMLTAVLFFRIIYVSYQIYVGMRLKRKKASNTEKLIMGSTASNSAPFCPSLVPRGNPFEAFLVLDLRGVVSMSLNNVFG